jgi:hypothetical protein
MRKFYISIRRNGKIFGSLEKIPFDLDPSANIVWQAEQKAALILDMNSVPETGRGEFSWKVFSHDGYKFMAVTLSKNWLDPW